MRYTVLFFALLITTASVLSVKIAHGDSFPFHSTTAKISAWNLAGFQKIPDEVIKRQAKALLVLDAEVTTLIEVNPDESAQAIVDEMNAAGGCYNPAVIVPQSARQNIAILSKCGIRVKNPQLISGSDAGNPALRKALIADVVVGNFDFILIGVHLKAGRSKNSMRIRAQQSEVIADYLTRYMDGREKDALVVGDYNMIPGQDTLAFSKMNKYQNLDFISSWDAKELQSHISAKGRGNMLDAYAIAYGKTKEYIIGSLRVDSLDRAMGMSLMTFRELVSDHLPISAEFRITRDDD